METDVAKKSIFQFFLQYSTVQGAGEYSTAQQGTVQCSTLQCSMTSAVIWIKNSSQFDSSRSMYVCTSTYSLLNHFHF